MIKHFAADGTVKREWPEGLHASGFEQVGKRFASVWKSNAVETVELADGEQVGETFVAAIASALAAADVHPIEAALSAQPLPPVAIAVVEAHAAVIPPAIPGSVTEHHVPLPSEVMETAAHALSDAAEVLREEETRNASNANALNVEPQEAQATHSTEAGQITTVEAQHG
jgi:hypothetical protein